MVSEQNEMLDEVIEMLDGYYLETKIGSILRLVEDEEAQNRDAFETYKSNNKLLEQMREEDSLKFCYILRTLLNDVKADVGELKSDVEQKGKSVQ